MNIALVLTLGVLVAVVSKAWYEKEKTTHAAAEDEKYTEQKSLLDDMVLALTNEERMRICDMGIYDNAIKGFLIQAMSFENFSDEDITLALNGMKRFPNVNEKILFEILSEVAAAQKDGTLEELAERYRKEIEAYVR